MKDDKNKKSTETEEIKDLEEDEKTENIEDSKCKGKCEELNERIEDCENKYKRALADYQNLEKRTFEERKDWIRSANRELILKLLPVLDTLMMASKHVDDQGLKISVQHFLDVLKGEGLLKIETVGKDFNPETMECIEAKKGEEGKVLEEIRSGYLLNDKVLRPAQVVVGGSEASS